MNIQQLTYPSLTLITLQEAKDHLRVTSDDEDILIKDCIRAATDLVEKYTNQLLLSRTYVAYLDPSEFQAYKTIEVWMYPVSAVTGVKYLNTSGVETGFTAYTVDLTDSPMRLMPTTVPTYQTNVFNVFRI
jgi:uncharacterized phiE125 gp8 family phage protein